MEVEDKSIQTLEEKIHKAPWGVLSCIDLYKCHPDLIRSETHIREYVKKLCELIDMKTYGSCHVVHFGQDPKVQGYSMFQLIETSCISGHFAEDTNAAYIDIFSCKPYDEEKAAMFSQDFFEADFRRIQINRRQ